MSVPEDTPTSIDPVLNALGAGDVILNRYRLEKLLGHGGMGVAWSAVDQSLGEVVAFKFLHSPLANDPDTVEQLKRETLKGRLLTHEHIIRIHDFVEDHEKKVAGIVMGYADGGSLSQRVRTRPNRWFEPEEVFEWITQLCEALDYAHQVARVVHRDLKPANLLLDGKDRLKVADFGIAHLLHESSTRVTGVKVTGTLQFMSPQQLRGEPPSPSDDLYSLGATMYELLTGKPPFYSGDVTLQALTMTPPSIAERRKVLREEIAPIPEQWESAIAALLAKLPQERPQSGREFLNSVNLGSGREGYVELDKPREPKAKEIGVKLNIGGPKRHVTTGCTVSVVASLTIVCCGIWAYWQFGHPEDVRVYSPMGRLGKIDPRLRPVDTSPMSPGDSINDLDDETRAALLSSIDRTPSISTARTDELLKVLAGNSRATLVGPFYIRGEGDKIDSSTRDSLVGAVEKAVKAPLKLLVVVAYGDRALENADFEITQNRAKNAGEALAEAGFNQSKIMPFGIKAIRSGGGKLEFSSCVRVVIVFASDSSRPKKAVPPSIIEKG